VAARKSSKMVATRRSLEPAKIGKSQKMVAAARKLLEIRLHVIEFFKR